MRLFTLICFITIGSTFSQDELMDLLDDTSQELFPVIATFKATRVVNMQSVELPRQKTLEFMVQHRFGSIKNGFYDLFGLDEAVVHYDLKYGISDKIAFGLGRSSWRKTYDFMLKIKLFNQTQGRGKTIPFSLVVFSNVGVDTYRKDGITQNKISSKMKYLNQFILGRKFNSRFSAQISPSWIHKNLVSTNLDKHDLFSFGLGGRIKLTNRSSINGDYFFPIGSRANHYKAGWGLGCDIETGGHVFQLMITNSRGGYEGSYIEDATGSFNNKNIFLGFNITRSFTL